MRLKSPAEQAEYLKKVHKVIESIPKRKRALLQGVKVPKSKCVKSGKLDCNSLFYTKNCIDPKSMRMKLCSSKSQIEAMASAPAQRLPDLLAYANLRVSIKKLCSNKKNKKSIKKSCQQFAALK
ncbi:MAG: hypothetical protein HRT44_00475 [Bdellovibrionales bacterium]|nr:hypothetical protein [Bdellovibrionales bacterium]